MERLGDDANIGKVIEAAFAGKSYSSQNEHRIVEALRQSGGLSLSLVADMANKIVGHIAFSPVRVGGTYQQWTALGPIAVAPKFQNQGIGSALIRAGLSSMKAGGAKGCILVGDPAYYGRFGFKSDPRIHVPWVEPQYFQWLAFDEDIPQGEAKFHPAFSPDSENG